ncbi:MAG: DUF4892 domain-containing protein [Hahellaceae bacterium]|nr:DUF4892 domain-containing protein [Hahellaceae bacterium]
MAVANPLKSLCRMFALMVAALTSMTAGGQSISEDYPYSSIEDEHVVVGRDYRVVTSPARKINNSLRVSSEIRADVTGTARRVLIDEGHEALTVFKHYQSVLQTQGGKLIFECHSRDCGQSNSWANDVFRQARLYGRDADQHYMVSVKRAGSNAQLDIVYVVERGNRQVLAYIQRLTTKAASVQEYLPTGSGNGLFVIDQLAHDLSFVPDPTTISEIIQFAEKEPLLHLYIIGHRIDDYETVAGALADSDQAAQIVADLLVRKGIDRNRVHSFGFGPLAPVNVEGRTGNRIEVQFLAPENAKNP